MTITHNQTLTAFGGGTSLACNVPTNSSGDTLIGVAVTYDDSASQAITITDFTSRGRVERAGVAIALEIFSKVSNGSEGATKTANFASGGELCFYLGSYSSASTISFGTASTNNGTGTTVTGLSVTAADTGVLVCAALDYFANLTTDSSMTRRGGSTSTNPILALFDEAVSTGATGDRTFTCSLGVGWVALMLVMTESGGGGGGAVETPQSGLAFTGGMGMGLRAPRRDDGRWTRGRDERLWRKAA